VFVQPGEGVEECLGLKHGEPFASLVIDDGDLEQHREFASRPPDGRLLTGGVGSPESDLVGGLKVVRHGRVGHVRRRALTLGITNSDLELETAVDPSTG
jgi:hypothetical protein